MTALSRGPSKATAPEDAFDVLYETCFARVVSALRLAGAGERDAEDIAQEAFVQVLVRWRHVHEPASYVFRTAFRLHRRQHRRSVLGRSLSLESQPAASLDPEATVVRRAEVHRALGQLTRRQRECAVLYFFIGFSTDEVADLLRISPPTVRVHIHEARKVLSAGEVADVGGRRYL